MLLALKLRKNKVIIINKEDMVKYELSLWLVKCGFKVWWEKKNDFGYDVFNVSGTGGKKPDLLIRDLIEDTFGAIEVKDAKDLRTALAGSKIINYYVDYIDGAKYYIEKREIKIDYFLYANQHSMFGKLFETDNTFEEHRNFYEHGGYPRFEFADTKSFIRQKFMELKLSPDRKDFRSDKYKLGFLLSNQLNNMERVGDVAMFFSYGMKRNGQWGHTFFPRLYKHE